jgi:hypothetical protein
MSQTTFATNGVHGPTGQEADRELDTLYAFWPGMQPAPAPCPEALFSCTVRGTLDGHETLLTVRGQTPEEFKRNLSEVRGLLDPPVQAPQVPAVQGPGWCALHAVQMQQHTNAKGSWFSHYIDGRHCKGK